MTSIAGVCKSYHCWAKMSFQDRSVELCMYRDGLLAGLRSSDIKGSAIMHEESPVFKRLSVEAYE
jgi:hypothetical protein